MTERIKGLSIGLDLDTIKVERGLTGLKDRLKTVNTEMKNNMSAFDRSDKSIGKYETRLNGLNKKIEVQTKITEEAEKKYKDMVEQHGEGSKQAERAAQEYNKQSAELNNLKNYTEGVTKELKALKEEQRIANSQWTKTGQKLDDTGKKMTKIGDGMQSFGKKWTAGIAIAGGAVVGLGVSLYALTNKVTENADAVAKGAARMGVSTDFYQEMDYWASQNGISHQSMENALQRLNQRMGLAAEGNKKYSAGLERLGIEMSAVEDGTLSTEDAFAQSIQSLSEMTNESEQAALAGELFGNKLGQELLPALRESALSIDDAKKMAEELGIVMSEDQLKAAEEFQDAQDSIKRAMGGIVNSIGLELMPQFQKMLDWVLVNLPKIRETINKAVDQVIERISAFMTWWRELSDGAKRWIKIAAVVAVAIGPLAIAFGTILKIVGPFVSILGKVFMWVGKVGGIMPALKIGFAALTGPVGLTVAAIIALVAGFTIAYNKSDTFRGIVHKVKDAFVETYKKIKEFLTTNPQLLGFIDSVKQGFATAKDLIIQAFGMAIDFVREKIAQVKAFWDSDGQQLLQAFKNIFSGISAVVMPIVDGIVAAFKWAFPYMESIFSVSFGIVLSVAKSIIGNIKGVIDGGLNFIAGLAKTFSGLFTGDFSKMWEGIKQLFSGAIQFVWNFIQLTFYGKILKGGMVFIKSFSGFFSSMWSGIRTTFSNVIKWIVDFVKNRFTTMQSSISTITTGIRDVFSRIWNFIWNGIIMPVVRGIVDFVRGRFNNMRDTIRSIFTTVRDTTKKIWNSIKDRIINPIRDTVSSIRTRFTDMKNRVGTIFSDLKTDIGKYISDMVETVKGMPKKMGDGLKRTAGKIGDGLKAVANKMTNALGKGVNGVIGGVNWVLDKVGVSSKISEWPVPQYAHGTGGHPGGLAVVGDGKGSNAGRELIETPDGKQYLSPARDTLLDLPKGTHVLSALQTNELLNAPKYAWGTLKEWGENAGEGTKAVGKTIKDSALDVWSYISNPSKLFNKALELMGVEAPEMGGSLKRVGTGTYKKSKDALKDFMTSKIEGFVGDGGNVPMSFGNLVKTSGFGYRTHPITGQAHLHGGVDFAGPIGTAIKAQVGGVVSSSGWNAGGFGNLVTIKNGIYDYYYAHLQKAIARVGSAVKKGDIIGALGNTGQSTGPHVHYEVRKNGQRINPGIGGFATGGKILKNGLYRLAEGGFPEYVIPTDPARRTDAQKLLAIAGKEIQGNKRPSQLPSPSGGDVGQQDDSLLRQLLEATLRQNEILSASNAELKAYLKIIAEKTANIYLGREKVGSQMDKEQAKRIVLQELGVAY